MKEGGPRARSSFLGRARRSNATDERKAGAITVRRDDVSVVTISPYASVAEAARRMTELGIRRLPVVKDGVLVGIVSRTDLVRAFVRSDEEIRREIREDVLRGAFCLEAPEAIGVEVDRGEVRLTGRLESPLDVELLPRLVARVPGVVAVDRS